MLLSLCLFHIDYLIEIFDWNTKVWNHNCITIEIVFTLRGGENITRHIVSSFLKISHQSTPNPDDMLFYLSH